MRSILNFNSSWNFYKATADINVKEGAELVNLPHSWNAEDGYDGGNDYYRGSCVYTKSFAKSELPEGELHYLQIEGANSSADVYLNGKHLAHHDGGYSTWRVNLTNDLADENTLSIVVDNAANEIVYPQMADFTFYGGLYRNVSIIAVPSTHFDLDYYGAPGIKITPAVYLFGGMGGRLDHTLANMSLVLSLAGQGKSAYLIGKDCVITSLCAGEKLWFSSACRGTLSVFAAGDRAEGVTLSGLLYPFTNGCLTNERALGVSNHFTAEAATVTLTSGKLYLLWDTVDNPLPERTK